MTAEPVTSRESALSSAQVAATESRLRALLERQRRAFLAAGPPDRATRIDRLDRAIALLVDHRDELVEALSEDFGHRSREQSLLTDVAASIEPLKFARRRVGRWMRPEKRKTQFPFGLFGARAEIRFQPLGVVGVISPWNFPVNLTFAPLAGILSAGNRAMIKPSEHTPRTSELMARIIGEVFDDSEIAVVTGGPEVGRAFSRLPFDHLLFTGSTAVAAHVMRAAAENLVPVTLELGGKSPVVVGRSASLEDTARKVAAGKLMNAGQICLAPDYVFVPEGSVEAFADATRQAVAAMYGSLVENPDYTSVIGERHVERLREYVEDARAKGSTAIELNPAGEDFSRQAAHKLPPVLVLEPSDDTKVMQEEIFGPVLPIKPYRDLDEVIRYVNEHPRPLALYYFGKDSAERERLLERTTSGGVTVNDVIMHVMMEDLPFGGVGPSGMGAYHGRDGFRRFSHAKAIYRQSRFDLGAMVRPPYGAKLRRLLKMQIRR